MSAIAHLAAQPLPPENAPEPKNRRPAGTRFALAIGVVGCVVTWPVMLMVLVAVVPKFDAIFRDFGMNLSPLARWLMDASRWTCGSNPGQVLPGAFGLVLAGLGVGTVLTLATVHPRTRTMATWAWLALALLGFVFAGVFIMGLYEPLLRMIASLQGGKTV